ncbi:uncharacterized protein LOC116342185 [Contarinia nasturtii]|uniref:uncharacterized protein LOC116342185 n=1 Tax=Contarinia nasturtii TaxID=265458 RepID=UPI0012D494A4|nr:uncharacterized protein LOC116342185 [Contarinia nasturtii]XP_031625548.1 uncharacterized protein LOC116342185 [Contarinia nasturtii]XP_031625549.1 uncharacterized protein LOC116342185 [Contarinia nasturtii]
MFSFHKPKVYRSATGCCICKAKSSSSRFTASMKYESDFEECFRLDEQRQGEICNACVLLVKRFKRMPAGQRRHWAHVVDARIGPGIKSMTKFKKRKEEQMKQEKASTSTEFAGQSNTNAQNIRNNSTMSERFGKIFKKTQKKKVAPAQANDENSQPTSPSSISDNDRMSDDASDDRLECYEDMRSIIGESATNRRDKRKQAKPMKYQNQTLHLQMHVIDLSIWGSRQICCGKFYESKKFGAILFDLNQFSSYSCSVHGKQLPSPSSSASTSPSSGEKKGELSSTIKLPRKKQLLRQFDATPAVEPVEQAVPIDYSQPTTSKSAISNAFTSNGVIREPTTLTKLRGNSGKVAKKTPKKNLNGIKNLVKLCTSQKVVSATAAAAAAAATTAATTVAATVTALHSAINKHNEQAVANENENITNTTTKATELIVVNKFSDNSSDSGYDEALHDTNQLEKLNQIVNIGTPRPVMLSNGVLLHVKNRENLLRAAKFAGVSQTAIQTTQANMKAMNGQTFQENTSSYNCIKPAHEIINNKPGVFMVTPSV